jgi:hypothetical protein
MIRSVKLRFSVHTESVLQTEYTRKNLGLTQLHTEVRFASFLSGGFNTMAVIDPPERKLEKRICELYYRIVI